MLEIDYSEQSERCVMGFLDKIKNGLSKTRDGLLTKLGSLCFKKADDEFFEELEEILIMSDIGAVTSAQIIDSLKVTAANQKINDAEEIKRLLALEISNTLENSSQSNSQAHSYPMVILMIGVNGVGKTTTIAKLANMFMRNDKKVMLAAGDTFRAAAIEQLDIWAQKLGVPIIKHQANADPGAVVFDAVHAAKNRNIDVLICDTAGRLHNKKNLMNELHKISNIISREFNTANVEVLLALDATTGQNALQQAKLFSEITNITGIVLTKLDSTAKGGIVIPIQNELKLPIRYVGFGEQLDDLQVFDAKAFAKALLDDEL